VQGKVTEVLFAQGVLAFCKVRERERHTHTHRNTHRHRLIYVHLQAEAMQKGCIKVIAEEVEGGSGSAATGASAGVPEAGRKYTTEEQLLEEAQQVRI
jgi:hypothetical protein